MREYNYKSIVFKILENHKTFKRFEDRNTKLHLLKKDFKDLIYINDIEKEEEYDEIIDCCYEYKPYFIKNQQEERWNSDIMNEYIVIIDLLITWLVNKKLTIETKRIEISQKIDIISNNSENDEIKKQGTTYTKFNYEEISLIFYLLQKWGIITKKENGLNEGELAEALTILTNGGRNQKVFLENIRKFRNSYKSKIADIEKSDIENIINTLNSVITELTTINNH